MRKMSAPSHHPATCSTTLSTRGPPGPSLTQFRVPAHLRSAAAMALCAGALSYRLGFQLANIFVTSCLSGNCLSLQACLLPTISSSCPVRCHAVLRHAARCHAVRQVPKGSLELTNAANASSMVAGLHLASINSAQFFALLFAASLNSVSLHILDLLRQWRSVQGHPPKGYTNATYHDV